MSGLLRDTAFGQVVRWASKNRIFQYPEERPDFQLPESYREAADRSVNAGKKAREPVGNSEGGAESNTSSGAVEKDGDRRRRSSASSRTAGGDDQDLEKTQTNTPAAQSMESLDKPREDHDLERVSTQPDAIERIASQPIAPTRTADGVVLVDWYTTDDPENPHNWANGKKAILIIQIYLYTIAVYMGSAIYTPSEQGVMEAFGVSATVAQLGLALYVLGYGTGPLLFSPLSEIPIIGRNPPYVITFGIFVILCIPTALVNNIGGLLVLRFLQGFFGSPCLATGGASMGDVVSLLKLSYFLTGWAAAATCGPALGPLISGFSVPAESWRWSLWEILWLAGPIFISMFFLLPETSSSSILLRRAQRLRKLTGNSNYKSQSEIDQAKMTGKSIAFEAVVRPWQINALDPAVLFTSVYIAIVYGIYYSFFEVFPLVYMDQYHMNVGQMGLVFLVISVSLAVATPIYFWYLRYIFEPSVKSKGLSDPERLLVPALISCVGPPIGLFIFGWTGRESIHWIVPTIGIFIYGLGVFILLQSIFIYVPLIYPQYAASLFAGNDFARSAFAAGAILFADPMFKNLGVGPGCSLLGGLAACCIAGVWALYLFGKRLREKSRFTVKGL